MFGKFINRIEDIFSRPVAMPIAPHNALPQARRIRTDNHVNGPLPMPFSIAKERLDRLPECVEQLKNDHNLYNVKYIAAGGYSMVYSANDSDFNQFALKSMMTHYYNGSRVEDWANRNRSELYFLARLQHDNVVKFYGDVWIKTPVEYYGETTLPERENCLILKTELLQTSLVQVYSMGPLPETVMTRLGKQMALALNYIHSRGIAHHDIKQDNVMIAEAVNLRTSKRNLERQLLHCTFKLHDMGLCRKYSRDKGLDIKERKYYNGTTLFLSPEKYGGPGSPYNPYLNDCYSLGIMMYWGLLGSTQVAKQMGTIDIDANASAALNKLTVMVEEYRAKWTNTSRAVPIVHKAITALLAPEDKPRANAQEVADILFQVDEWDVLDTM